MLLPVSRVVLARPIMPNKNQRRKRPAKRAKAAAPKQSKTSSNSGSKAPTSRVAKPALLPVISQCGRDYLQALMNPFSGILACLPSEYINSNFISFNFVRGTFSCGPLLGWIACDPRHGAVNDTPCVISSTNAFAGNIFDLNTAVGTNQDNSNSNFVQGQIGAIQSDISFRIVGAGLRIRYTGKNLDRGGSIVALCDPTHTSLHSRSVAQMNGERQTRRFPVTNSWTTVLYRPVETNDFVMLDSLGPAVTYPPNITNNTNHWFMGMAVVPASATALSPFEYEFVEIVEYQGRNVRGQRVSHADPVAMTGAIQAAAMTAPHQSSSETVHVTAMRELGNYLRTGVSHLAQVNDYGFGELVHLPPASTGGKAINPYGNFALSPSSVMNIIS